MTVAEQPDWGIHAFAAMSILMLMFLYNVGIWSRSYVLPVASGGHSLTKQLIVGLPVGLVTMGLYGKTAIPGLDFGSPNMLFDGATVAGNAIIFGMLSRESLDKLLKTVRPPMPAADGQAPAGG